MFIEKKMLGRIDEYMSMAAKKEEDVVCYLDKENNNEDIKQLLFSIGNKNMKAVIGKKIKLQVEGIPKKQDVIFMINSKEKLDFVTNLIDEWAEDYIPLLTEKKIKEIINKKIVVLIEKKHVFIEWQTQMKIKKDMITYIKEQERVDEIMDFKKVTGGSFERYKTSFKEELIKESLAVEPKLILN